MSFEIHIKKSAEKELEKLPRKIKLIISKEIIKLSANPYPTRFKKLKTGNGYRIRIGVYRVIYVINKKSKNIAIMKVAHRKDVYN